MNRLDIHHEIEANRPTIFDYLRRPATQDSLRRTARQISSDLGVGGRESDILVACDYAFSVGAAAQKMGLAERGDPAIYLKMPTHPVGAELKDLTLEMMQGLGRSGQEAYVRLNNVLAGCAAQGVLAAEGRGDVAAAG